MSSAVAWLDRKLYPGFARNWDDSLFRARLLSGGGGGISPDDMILDLGAGAGIIEQMNFKSKARRVCGVDLDPRVLDNPMLDEGKVADAGRIPYGDATFDLVFSDNVLEHLAEPLPVFREIARVLKPGGSFWFKTPNKWHYVPTIARLTPHGFHAYVNRWRGRVAADVFPTLYRANSTRDVAKLAAEAGLEIASLERIEGRPEYLRLSAPTYVAGAIYERIVNSTEMLAPFRVILIGHLRKAGA